MNTPTTGWCRLPRARAAGGEKVDYIGYKEIAEGFGCTGLKSAALRPQRNREARGVWKRFTTRKGLSRLRHTAERR
jgi:hypothetical protein